MLEHLGPRSSKGDYPPAFRRLRSKTASRRRQARRDAVPFPHVTRGAAFRAARGRRRPARHPGAVTANRRLIGRVIGAKDPRADNSLARTGRREGAVDPNVEFPSASIMPASTGSIDARSSPRARSSIASAPPASRSTVPVTPTSPAPATVPVSPMVTILPDGVSDPRSASTRTPAPVRSSSTSTPPAISMGTTAASAAISPRRRGDRVVREYPRGEVMLAPQADALRGDCPSISRDALPTPRPVDTGRGGLRATRVVDRRRPARVSV